MIGFPQKSQYNTVEQKSCYQLLITYTRNKMDMSDIFKQYRQILLEGIEKVRKSGYKKLNLFRDMIDTLEVFINKEAYGRIVPGNYVLLFILMMGSRQSKLLEASIRTMQKLFSYNYIHEHEELSTNLLKEEFKEYLLVDPATLKNKSVSEIYLETLMAIQERDEAIILLIIKNLSLVVRLFQHCLSSEIIKGVFYYLTDMLMNKPTNIDKTIKSTIIQIVRHILENLREIDFNILVDNDAWSLKKVCRDTLTGVVDQIVIKQAVTQKYGETNWKLIPNADSFDDFELFPVEVKNEKNVNNGKFGWCISCREPANYYCKILRVPVCSFACKTKYLSDSQDFDKLLADENRAQQFFLLHSKMIISCLSGELAHLDQRRRSLAIEIVNFVLAEPKRFKNIKNYVKDQLSLLVRQCLGNVVSESEAFSGCLTTIKKLLYLGSFLSEAELFFEMISSKLLSVQTNAQYKLQILKCLKDILNNQIVADLFVSLDCDPKRKNSIETILKTIAILYRGTPVPEGIIYEEDPRIKKMCYDIMTELIGSLVQINKKMDPFNPAGKLAEKKAAKKLIDDAMAEFNDKDIKPQKSIKKLAALGAFNIESTEQIAKFLHKNIDNLSSVKIGELIGGHTDFCKAVLSSFSEFIEFSNLQVDGGLRHLLDHFTMPGEGQQVDRIIESFSIKYYRDNPSSVFLSSSPVYSLSYLMMMLQTNLHNPQVQEKMKFAQFFKLAKGMNEKNDFPLEFLQGLYNSIQKSQLGFHQKQKEKDFVSAYTQGGRKLADMCQKQLDKMIKRVYSQFKTFGPVTNFKPRTSCIPLLLEAACRSIVSVLIASLQNVQEKDACVKILEYMQAVINLCINNHIITGQQVLIEQLSKKVPDELVTIKQFLLTQALLDWSVKYTEHINKSWKFVFSVISRFSRRKAIVKTKENKKSLIVLNQKVALQESFIQQLIAKTGELPQNSTIAILNGMLEVSREEIRDGELIFCLQKVGDFVEYNLQRIGEVFNSIWPLLRDYYFELGISPNEKIALFGVDFLKQTITKLMKKKQTIGLQKEFFKPYEMIFANTNLLSIKEFIIGTIISLCTHNAAQLRYGWRVILSILASSFEDSEPPEIKAKSYQALNKLIQSNLSQLEEFYIDLTQILVKLTRQKEQVYVAGCISFVKEIIEYYNKKLNIEPKTPNPAADISFLQATWLPLLGILSTICGDHRSQLQNTAINYLFALLMDFGCLFKYEFWKMVFQGVLRPTFDQILYTFQIRNSEANRKDTLIWLKTSCEKLFDYISELISVYYEDFRLFLPDIFKIYENCTQHANELLTKLSINAVKTLIHKVADKFSEQDWEHFLQFFHRLFKKTTPTELLSLQAWKQSKQSSQYNQTETYGAKCLSQLMLLGVVEEVLCKFSMHLSEKHLDFLYNIIKQSYEFSSNFNKQIELRKQLWQEGFIAQMKQLPGLLKQERESLKCLILVEYYRYQLAQHGQQEKFEQYVRTVLGVLRMYVSKHKQLLQPNENELARQQTERQALNMRILVRDTVIEQIEQNGLNSIVAYKDEFFQAFLEMLKYSSTLKRPCTNCKRCDKCTENLPVEIQFDETLNKLIIGLFHLKS